MGCVAEIRFGFGFVIPANFFQFRDASSAFHGIGQLFFCTRSCRRIRRHGGRSGRGYFLGLRFLRLPGWVEALNRILRHAVLFLPALVRASTAGGLILRIAGRVR